MSISSLYDKDPWDKSGKGFSEGLSKEFEKWISEMRRRGSGGGMPSGSFNFGMKFVPVMILLAIMAYFLSGFYVVAPDEEAAELVMGKYVGSSDSGLRYNWPAPIGKVFKVKTKRINKEDIGNASQDPSGAESLMLTGDENIVNVNAEVQWKVDNIYNYLFKVEDYYGSTVRSVAESAVREVVGKNAMAFVIQGKGRAAIASEVHHLLQEILDSYSSGVKIVSVQMKKIDPPYKVIDAFRDVQSARADKERLVNEAFAYVNSLLPRANAEAFSIVEKAKSMSAEIVNSAEGNTKRFKSIVTEYQKNKLNTKKRLYLETMEKILGANSEKLVLSDDVASLLPQLFAAREGEGKKG